MPMSSRLDEIKARAEKVAAKREDTEPTFAEFAAILRLGNFDVPVLVAAVEEVLELHKPAIWPPSSFSFDDPTATRCKGCARRYPCPTVQAINTALGEGQK